MPSRIPAAGLGSPCESCGQPMLASLSGRGYCLACDPVGDAPLVPVTWSVKKFQRIKKAFERAVREHNEDVRTWRRYLAPGSRPGSLRAISKMRMYPADADELVIPLTRRTGNRRPSRAGGRPRALTAAAEERLRRWVRAHPFSTVASLAKKFKASPRTIRRSLNRLGLKLKKRSARRAPRR